MKNTYKILIVDDEHIYIEIISEALEKEVNNSPLYEILQANNGKSALQIMEKYPIDLVITDWEMPQMNGIELIEKIRAKPSPIEIQIIVATGVMVGQEHLKKALDAGANDFVRKPIDAMEIRARVNAALRTLSLQHQLLEEQKRLFSEKTLALEQLSLQMNRKNKIINQLKKQAEETQKILNINFLPHLNKLIKTINTELDTKKDWKNFDFQAQYIYPDFWQKLNEKYANFTRNEKQLCLHIKNNKTSQEIAELLSVSVRTIEMARYRLRKKLNLPVEVDLIDFIKNL